MALLDRIIKEHLPNQREYDAIKLKIDDFLNKIGYALKKSRYQAEIMLGGSAAKGTFLVKDFDVDIFIRFDYGYKERDISELLEKVLIKIKDMKISRVHGSRDYFQVRYKGIKYEIIPVLKVQDSKKALNVTDMSPLHVEWLKKHLNGKFKNEIILAKLFCKAQGFYGAESYIRGFSGHVLDILIIYYGGFIETLKASQKWNINNLIDIEKHGTAEGLNQSKISPLIVIDPIQPERNAAAALSEEKFRLFIEKAGEFLNKPSAKYFIKKEYKLNDLKKLSDKSKNTCLIVLNVNALEGKEDIVGAKLLKAYRHILKHLSLNEFIVKDSGWKWDKAKKAMFWYVLNHKMLSESVIRMGPPLNAKKATKSFKLKHPKAFEKDKRLYAPVNRLFRKPEDLINHLITDTYFLEKVERVTIKLKT
ncbi:MAG: CCA tRNA nucleotidyltransferase [Candidatus Woesearchaeota archaeon]